MKNSHILWEKIARYREVVAFKGSEDECLNEWERRGNTAEYEIRENEPVEWCFKFNILDQEGKIKNALEFIAPAYELAELSCLMEIQHNCPEFTHDYVSSIITCYQA